MGPLPSLTLLSSKTPTQNRKRQKCRKLPCPPELRYQDGEIVNVDSHNRLMGASSSFREVASPSIPLDTPVRSWEELQPIIGALGVMTSMDSVLRELYRKPPLSERPTKRDEWALRFSYGNTHKPQYYFHTLEAPATVVHIITGGEFWCTGRSDIGKLKSCHVHSSAYTNLG